MYGHGSNLFLALSSSYWNKEWPVNLQVQWERLKSWFEFLALLGQTFLHEDDVF
jgi:hypothetical protein